MKESRTLKDWLLSSLGKSDAVADYLAQRRPHYRLRPPPDFDDFSHSNGADVNRRGKSQSD